MAPEIHMAQILPDLDYRYKNVICPTPPHYNRDALQLSFNKVFTKSNGLGAEAGQTLFRAP
jgi:hypothetical protein